MSALQPFATDSERSELRTQVKSIRQEWRERLSLATKLSPRSKLAKRAGVLMLDLDSLDDRIQEAGGEEELVFHICAQIASGCTLTDWCQHYMIERGLLWAFLSETPERLAQYERAQRGIADELVAQTVAISDEQSEVVKENGQTYDPDVARDKLRVETRLKVAAAYDKKRFGVEKISGNQPSVGMVIDAGLAFAASELLARIARPVATERVVATQEQPQNNWL